MLAWTLLLELVTKAARRITPESKLDPGGSGRPIYPKRHCIKATQNFGWRPDHPD